MNDELKLKAQESVTSIDYYLRTIALQNILIKLGIISKEDFEKEYVQVATNIVSKFKKEKLEEKK